MLNTKPINNAIYFIILKHQKLAYICINATYTVSQNYKRYEIKDKSRAATNQHIIKMDQTCHIIYKPIVSRIKLKPVEDTKISLNIKTDKMIMKCM